MKIPIRYSTNAANAITAIAVYSALALSPIRTVAQMSMPSSQPQSQSDASRRPQETQAPATQGKQQTWTGEITTAMCKETRSSMGHDCILNCVKAGEKLVLVTKGGSVENISNQDFSNLKEHAGHHVRLTGHFGPDGKSITVTKIEMADRGSS